MSRKHMRARERARPPTPRMLAVLEAVRVLGNDADPLAVADHAKILGRDDNERRGLAKQALSTLRNRGLLPPIPPLPKTERSFDPSIPLSAFPDVRVPRAKLAALAASLWLPATATLAQVERAIASLSREDHRAAMRRRLLQAAERP